MWTRLSNALPNPSITPDLFPAIVCNVALLTSGNAFSHDCCLILSVKWHLSDSPCVALLVHLPKLHSQLRFISKTAVPNLLVLTNQMNLSYLFRLLQFPPSSSWLANVLILSYLFTYLSVFYTQHTLLCLLWQDRPFRMLCNDDQHLLIQHKILSKFS